MSKYCPQEYQRETARQAGDRIAEQDLRITALNEEADRLSEHAGYIRTQRDTFNAEVKRVVRLNDQACDKIVELADELDGVTADRNRVTSARDQLLVEQDDLRTIASDRYHTIDRLVHEAQVLRDAIVAAEAQTVAAMVSVANLSHERDILAGILPKAQQILMVDDHGAMDAAVTEIERLTKVVASVTKESYQLQHERDIARNTAKIRYTKLDEALTERDIARETATKFAVKLDEIREDAKDIVANVNEDIRETQDGEDFPDDVEHWFG
jgi:chromosome segregation ATPase